MNQEERQLIISGERRRPTLAGASPGSPDNASTSEERPSGGMHRRKSERRFGKFERKLGKLPEDADLDAVTARCVHAAIMLCPALYRRRVPPPREARMHPSMTNSAACTARQHPVWAALRIGTLYQQMCACPATNRVEKGVLTVWIRKAEGARPNIKDVFID